jgi:hypothetical protein
VPSIVTGGNTIGTAQLDAVDRRAPERRGPIAPGKLREHRRPDEVAFRHRGRVQRELAQLDPRVLRGLRPARRVGPGSHQVGDRRPGADLDR